MKNILFLKDIKKIYGEDAEIVYKNELYEPFLRSGYGISGALIKNKKEELLCNDCGKFFYALAHHIKVHYKENPSLNYKDKHQLFRKIALIPRQMSRHLSMLHQENKLKLFSLNSDSHKKTLKNRKIVPPIAGTKKTAYKNTVNRCDPQKLFQLGIIAHALHKKRNQLTSGDVSRMNPPLYRALLLEAGGIEKAIARYNLIASKPRVSPMTSIAIFHQWVRENKKIPSISLWKKLSLSPSVNTFLKNFGSWEQVIAVSRARELLKEGGEK